MIIVQIKNNSLRGKKALSFLSQEEKFWVEVNGKSYHDRANKVTSTNIMILQSHQRS